MLQNAGGEVASLKKPFEEVAAENQAWLYRYICRLLGKSGPAAEDLLQETLIKCFKAYGSYVEQGSLEAWLSSVARNTVMSYLRSRNRFDIISAFLTAGLTKSPTLMRMLTQTKRLI